ncbi:hypothetical protein E4U60_003789 [Claviceps pazoutovae]|uniref:non-specific serine/threonine protein kinase n=1 Tax=Claviceps pazoutovae TaxID=1649127 RepID=A0A9P7M9U4_9HYPO|nr:hypothetical protein E4U60_003789 [Claviceps pazoutovae]
MATSLFRRSLKPLSDRAWKPLAFPSSGFYVMPADEKFEEETIPGYKSSDYYPVRIGEVFRDRYQAVGKIGFGMTSTVWLARDLSECRHVTLKVLNESKTIHESLKNELHVFKRIETSSIAHPGRGAVRSLLDTFEIDGPNGRHRCLVHPALWENLDLTRRRTRAERFSESAMASVLKRLFHALDLLHQECHIAHTDISETNIQFGTDEAVLSAFEQEELDNPCPRKEADGRTVYVSRMLQAPEKLGAPVLCDFGSAMRLDDGIPRLEDIQPSTYRAPEVILEIPWTSSVDIWNVGCMIWDSFQGGNLFSGRNPETGTYQSRAHLAEMIALLGPPPPSLLARANLRSKFFSDAGEFCAGIPIPEPRPLEQREMFLQGENKDCFLRFMRKMLQWEPEKRSSAKELAEDEWIVKQYEHRRRD